MNPDILCLQEFNVQKLPLLEKELNKYYSYTTEIVKQRRKLKGKLYSRFDLTDIRVYKPNSALDTLDYPVSFRKSIKVHNRRQPFYSAVAHLPSGDSVVVYSCHLQSNGYSSIRRQMKNEDWAKGIPNYYSSIKNAEKIRQWEACNLRYYIDSLYPSRNVIVAGDFNDFSASKSIKTVTESSLKDAWWSYGNGVGITYLGFHLFFRLDHILVTNRVTVRKIDVGDCRLSDHRPLVVDLDICNKW
jgi:endonuclease/exonuclease/phosphatase family metal-dependent hydrolase